MTERPGIWTAQQVVSGGLALAAILGSVFVAFVVTAPEAHPVARVAFAAIVGVIVGSHLLHEHDMPERQRVVVMAREDVSEFVAAGEHDDG